MVTKPKWLNPDGTGVPTGIEKAKVIGRSVGKYIWDRTSARLFGSGIEQSKIAGKGATAKWSGRSSTQDWRVKLTVPTGASELRNEIFSAENYRMRPLLSNLEDSGGFHWPLTPTCMIQHSANYNPLSQTHSNYPFQAYQNSQVDQISVFGEFPVQNQDDAKYWVAVVAFLRTITKMFFGGDTALKGNPPPILHLSGYGDHVFNKVPVVLNNFTVELRQGIDYISTRQNDVYNRDPGNVSIDDDDQTWAPTISQITCLLTPVYSRDSIKKFNLRDFASGKLNKDTGIGFI